MSKYFTIRAGIASYPCLITPKKRGGSTEAKYSVDVLIPKTDDIQYIYDHMLSIWKKRFPSHHKIPPNASTFLKDGDEKMKKEGEADYRPDEMYAGYWYVSCYADECTNGEKTCLALRDVYNRPIDTKAEDAQTAVQAGDKIRVAMQTFAYDFKGRTGISCRLRGVQVLKKGVVDFGIKKIDQEEENDIMFSDASGEE